MRQKVKTSRLSYYWRPLDPGCCPWDQRGRGCVPLLQLAGWRTSWDPSGCAPHPVIAVLPRAAAAPGWPRVACTCMHMASNSRVLSWWAIAVARCKHWLFLQARARQEQPDADSRFQSTTGPTECSLSSKTTIHNTALLMFYKAQYTCKVCHCMPSSVHETHQVFAADATAVAAAPSRLASRSDSSCFAMASACCKQ